MEKITHWFCRTFEWLILFYNCEQFFEMAQNLKCKHQTLTISLNFLKEIFSRFGVPETIVSDNGTQFTSCEFAKFCKFYFYEHITTPVYHLKSNGQVKWFVDSFKCWLKKIYGEQNEVVNLQQFLRIYRINPNPNTQSSLSPAELMFGRRVKLIYDRLLPGCKINIWKNQINIKQLFSTRR